MDTLYQHFKESNNNQAISALDCFNSLTEEQKKLVESSTTILEFKKGETIIKQGFVASHILYIEKGLAKLEVTDDHKTTVVKLLTNDSFVGIICSFACKSVDFSSTALEDTTIRMIDMSVFTGLIKENGEFALKLISHMSNVTNSIVHWMSRLTGKNVEGALAMILLEFQKIYGKDKYTLPVTRIGLSSLAGCSKESVIHVLHQFHSEGLIEADGKEINILQKDKLELIIKNS